MSDRSGRDEAAEFDKFASSYRQIIDNDRFTRLVGGSFEYFIELRLDLALARVADKRTHWRQPRILDFGCGIGAAAARLAARVPDAVVTGIDPSAESIRSAEAMHAPRTRFVVSESIALPFPDETFDLVHSNGTFHHIPHRDHSAIFSEFHRVLKPGGDAFVFENNPFNPATVLAMRLSPLDKDARMVLPPVLRRGLEAVGLRCESPRYYIFFPGLLKALRPTERFLSRLPLGGQYFVHGERQAVAA